MTYNLRGSQPQAVQKGLEVLRDKKGRRELLIASTGYGKSLCIASIAKELTDGIVLCLQPSIDLLLQNVEKIESFGVYPSVYSASANRKELGNLIYATPKSVSYEVLKDLNIKYVLWDEADFASKEDSHTIKLLKQLKIKNVLGLTASAFNIIQTNEGAVTEIITNIKGSFFTDICFVNQIQEMVENKFWSDIKYYNVFNHSKQGLLQLNDSYSEYTEESQKSFYEACDLKNKIADFLKRMPENENALVFVPDIEKAEELKELLPNSVAIHSKVNKKDRLEFVKGFKENKYKIAITPLALLAGFDKPDLINLIDATASNSIRIKLQKDGRSVRCHPNKKEGRIVDFVGNFLRYGDVRNYRYEYIENVGWCLFNNQILLTGIPMNRIGEVTKEDLIKNGKPNFEYVFGEHNKGDAKVNFGKFKNKPQTVKYLYYRQRHYLRWLAFSDFQFKDKELERQIKTIWNVPYELEL